MNPSSPMDPAPITPDHTRRREDPGTPGAPPESAPSLSVGVIVWGHDEPTVIAHRDPQTLARTMALLLHEVFAETDFYAGAPAFLETHAPPQDWVDPADVDDWLQALRERTSTPGISFHQIPLSGGADGTNRTQAAGFLSRLLHDREQALADTQPDRDPAEPTGRAHLDR